MKDEGREGKRKKEGGKVGRREGGREGGRKKRNKRVKLLLPRKLLQTYRSQSW